jgi:hypothetical protein
MSLRAACHFNLSAFIWLSWRVRNTQHILDHRPFKDEKYWKHFFSPLLTCFRNSIAFWKVPRLPLFIILETVECEALLERYWQRKTEVRSRRRTCLVGTSSATELPWTSRGSIPFLRAAMPADNRLNHGTAVKDEYQPEVYLKIQSVPRSKHSLFIIKTSQSMLCREIIAACSQIHTKHTNTLCGQNVELFNFKPRGTYSNRWAVKG